MSSKNIESLVFEIAEPIANGLKYELVEVEYKREGSNWFLRLFIDKDGGVSIDDCQRMSEKVGKKLDSLDPIDHNYYLEVSSMGLDRPLKKDRDFERHKDEEVELKLYRAMDGKKTFVGRLIGLIDGSVHIEVDGEEMIFAQKDIAIVRLYIDF